jgi:DNA-binding FadR family transcriptional regulator
LHYRIVALANQFALTEPQAQEVLIGMAQDGLIVLRAWDGQGVRAFHDWPSSTAFFYSTLDGGNFRVHVLAKGAELLEDLPRDKIGF